MYFNFGSFKFGLFYYSPKTNVNFIGNLNNTGEKTFTFKDYMSFQGGISAVLKGDGEDKSKTQRIEEAKKILERPSVETVVEKSTNVQGRLRTIKTINLDGKKNWIADYKENN